jgi:hypothetical protein
VEKSGVVSAFAGPCSLITEAPSRKLFLFELNRLHSIKYKLIDQ